MTKGFKIILIVLLISIVVLPSAVFAGSGNFYYSAWFPFWKKSNIVQDFTRNIDKFHEVNLFAYEVQKDGTLKDMLKMQQSGPWLGWLGSLDELKIKIIPTITWFNGQQINNTLSNPKLRKAHIKELVKLASIKPYGGVDIDYENKKAETNVYFSKFLKELSSELHKKKKILACSIEARTPLTSRFKEAPSDIAYANDYKMINKYCDDVRIMAYDQGNDDIILNKKKRVNGNYYMPIADPDWVEKVIIETTKTINRKKILLGIPTYGHEYSVVQTNGIVAYEKLRSLSYKDAVDLAKELNITPQRNNAGELSFVYTKQIPSATSTPKIQTRFVSFTDAEAVKNKIKLAKKYKLKGVIFFKVDDEGDPAFWNAL